MKWAAALAFVGFCLMVPFVFFHHDLRGWTPAVLNDPSLTVEPIRPGARGFTLGECLPGTLSPWEVPRSADGAGNATLTVLSCSSRSRASVLLLCYGAVLALSFGIAIFLRRRS